ncbi:Rha family transcriptional regulator [Desulfovibrio legallii]|uniref:Phage regulatory protein, rha family n=1 Tax=Desulfovibrio legallii TaxID=571438 RepID=A0A1G7QDM3_9BACT|nr:Rha family transcriptional regulator [Desulfovibrio legallii]SDF96602.1 phage regulatory protein, rha family [Desulfovibrio legallii]
MEGSQNNTQAISTQPFENIVQIDDDEMFTTSLIIAEAFEKEHKNVLQAIENLECSPEFHRLNFQPMVYEAEIGSGAKREFPAYRLTRDGFAFLAMGFTGKKAAAWKEKFLEAFNAMEVALLKRQEVTESAGPDFQKIQDAKPAQWTLFSAGKKLTVRQIEALKGLIRMVAYVEKTAEENVVQDLLVAMQARRLEDLQKDSFYAAFTFLWKKIFVIRNDVDAADRKVAEAPDGIAVISGLLDLWAYISLDYSKQAVTNYVCNSCNISNLEEITTETAVTKAIFAVFRGIVGRTISPDRMRFI